MAGAKACWRAGVGQVLLFLCFPSVIITQYSYIRKTSLQPEPTYMVAAPKLVRPGQTINVLVSLFRITGPMVRVSVSVRRQGVEMAAVEERFTRPTSKLLQMKMLLNARPGNYTLRMEGLVGEGLAGRLFVNETRILFDAKRVSVFIQTDKPLYKMKQTVRFRVIAITPDQFPVKTGSMNIFVRDAGGNAVQRWVGAQLFNGVYEGSFPTTHPMKYGWWKIEVVTAGYTYDSQFRVEGHFPERFYVNLTMPSYIKDNEYALAGIVMANHTSGRPMEGEAKVYLAVQPPGKGKKVAVSEEVYPYFKGVASFLFRLEDIRNYTSQLAGSTLFVRALVTDFYHTNEREWTSKCVIYDTGIRLKFMGGGIRTFKPGVPFDAYLAVYESDGTPLRRSGWRVVQIDRVVRRSRGSTKGDDQYTAIIPDDSIVRYTFTPENDATTISIRATYNAGQDGDHEGVEMVAHRHYTESKHYLTVTSSTDNPQVHKYMVFTVRNTLYVPEVSYLVISGGRILMANTVAMRFQQTTFSFALSPQMVPHARILVYCLLPNGEILADSLNFHVEGVGSDKLLVTPNKGKDFSGRTIELNALTYPGTYVATAAMDYDVYRQGGNRETAGNVFFTKTAVEEELATYDPLAHREFSHTWFLDDNRRETVHRNGPSYAIDANTTFDFAGLVVFTDARLTRIIGSRECNHTQGYLPCHSTGCYLTSQHCDGLRQCQDGADELLCADPKERPPQRPDEFSALQRMWYYLDGAHWAWHSQYTKPNGKHEFKVSMPIRPTTWVVGGFALSPDHGLVFTQNPARLDTTRPFYVIVDVTPKSIIGEQLGVRVSVFNYWKEPIEAMLTLEGSKKYLFVVVEAKGVTSSYNPRTVPGPVQVMVYLDPGTQKWVHFPVLPLVAGKVPITIKAEAGILRQVVKKTVTIGWNGVTNIYHTPYLINLVSQGSLIISDLWIEVPEIFVHPEQREHLFVPGSAKAFVSLVGDVMGPGFYKPSLSVDKVHDYGEGSGADYIFNFAVNLVWLQFLKQTNQLSGKARKGALGGMLTAFKSILPYQMKDRGVAMRRKRTRSSIMLTAFALQTLADGSDPEWEDMMYIDVEILNGMAGYIIRQQNTTSGAFRRTTNWLDLKLNDGFVSDDGVPMNLSLTAYVTIALSRSLRTLTGEVQGQAEASKNLAAEYLAQNLDRLTDPFDICIVTYALITADHRARSFAFQRMREVKRQGEYVYWSAKVIPTNPFEIINTVPIMSPRRTQLPYGARAVQASAYALLSYLRNNLFTEAESIMLWLQTQRNTEHGFAGSQDTIVALQALKAYGERLANRDLYRMEVNLESTAKGSWKHTVFLDKGNFLHYNRFNVPLVWGAIKATAKGMGLALCQMRVEVNVEYPWQLRVPQERSFDLEVEKLIFYGRNASHALFRICARWTRTDIAPRSGAAVVEVDIPSGYHALRRRLNKVVSKSPLNMHRFRSPWGKLFAYFDYIDNNRTCFEFTVDRWYPVANGSIQHRIRIYDQFEPGFQNTTLYTTFGLFHLHICQVCGSFQCPYCPFYNAATIPRVDVIIVCVVTILAFMRTFKELS